MSQEETSPNGQNHKMSQRETSLNGQNPKWTPKGQKERKWKTENL